MKSDLVFPLEVISIRFLARDGHWASMGGARVVPLKQLPGQGKVKLIQVHKSHDAGGSKLKAVRERRVIREFEHTEEPS